VAYDRNRELGDRCAFCLGCGWGRRFMGGDETEIPQLCPDCGGRVLSACPACEAPIVSLMSIACRECGEPLREPELFGVEIRRKPEKAPIRTPAVDGEPASDDNVSRSR
jgi:hypothetical protein